MQRALGFIKNIISQPRQYTLFGNQNSGHAYKAALMLTLCHIDFEYRHISLARSIKPSERPADFLKVSRFGQVFVLVHGTTAICQSNVILSYSADQTSRFGGASFTQKLRVQEWLFWEAEHIGHSLPSLRYLYLAEIDQGELKEHLRKRTERDLDAIESALEADVFLIGEEPTIADISCCGYLYWADEAKIDISKWTRVERWLQRIARLARWRFPNELMASHELLGR